MMFVPSHRDRMVERALAMEALDAAILDLEDGVPIEEKPTGRTRLRDALARSSTGPARFVRVNAPASGELDADLEAVVRPGLDGIVLPKVDTVADLASALGSIDAHERAAGMSPVAIVVSIESARGLIAAPLLAAETRVSALLFGAEDFALDLGLPARREAEASELLYARSAVVVAATAARRLTIDGIWPDLDDEPGLRQDALRARRLGFAGKSLIHPKQVAVINECFTPDDRELEEATRIVEEFERGRAAGRGAVALDGKLLDPPVVDRARRVLDARRK